MEGVTWPGDDGEVYPFVRPSLPEDRNVVRVNSARTARAVAAGSSAVPWTTTLNSLNVRPRASSGSPLAIFGQATAPSTCSLATGPRGATWCATGVTNCSRGAAPAPSPPRVERRPDGLSPRWPPDLLVKLPTRTGWVQRSTGTTHKPLAKAIARMLEALGPKGTREWDLLDAVLARELHSASCTTLGRGRPGGPPGSTADVDLTGHLDAWQAWLGDRIADRHASHYLAYLRTLMPDGRPFWRSDLTAPAVARWLATRASLVQKRGKALRGSRRQADAPARPISGGTKRKYLAAVQSFAKYLLEVGVLASNPLRDVCSPAGGRSAVPFPRCRPDVLRSGGRCSAAAARAIYALAYGAGLEVSAILRLVDADIDAGARRGARPGHQGVDTQIGSPAWRTGRGPGRCARRDRCSRANDCSAGWIAGGRRRTPGASTCARASRTTGP